MPGTQPRMSKPINIIVAAIFGGALLGSLASCDKATTVIGTKCGSDGDCNVAGQKCVAALAGTGPKICTRPCTGEYGAMGCPIDYDCRSADGTAFYCLKAPYTVDGSGTPVLFSKTCA